MRRVRQLDDRPLCFESDDREVMAVLRRGLAWKGRPQEARDVPGRFLQV